MNKIKLLSLMFFFMLLGTIAFAQQQLSVIKGRVTTSDGVPAAFISVGIKGKGIGTVTNDKGEFTLNKVKSGKYVIRVSAVGLQPDEKEVSISDGNDIILNFTLTENSDQLKEVNISGNGVNKFATKKSEFVAKMPLTNLENPQTYTTISKELMAEQLVTSVDDATRNVPGLQKMWEATARAGDGGAYYSSRGFIVQSKLRNGIAGNISSRIDAANLERLEVIKGPSATLFGSALTSYGGLINRVTKKPYDHFGGEVTFNRGSFDFQRLAIDVNTPIDKENQVYARLNAAYNYKGSFQDSGFDRNLFVAPSLSYKVNDRLDFQFDAELSSGQNIGRPVFFFYFPSSQLGFNRADQAGLDYKKSYMSNDLTQVYKNNTIFAQANYKISSKWTSQTNFTHSYSYSNGRSPYFFLVPDAVALNNPALLGANFISRADQSTRNGKLFNTEVQQLFNGEFNIGSVKNRVVIGLDYLRENSDIQFYSIDTFDLINKNGNAPNYADFNEANLTAFYAANKFSSYPYSFKNNTYSAFVSDVVNITDRLIALAALRVDRFNNNTGTSTYSQTAFSPKFGLVFQPIKDQLSLFANYQNGFTNKNGTDVNRKAFKPEQANQLEGGVKMDAFGGKLSGTVSYYYIKVKDILRPDPVTPNFSIQDGNKISKGIEAELNVNPFAGMNIVAGFTYNDNWLVNTTPDVEGRRDGASMSPYTANLWISYKLQTGGLKGLGLGFGGNYASDNKVQNSTTSVFTLPEYTVLNSSIFYDHKKFRIGAKVDNLTNKHYWIGYTTMNPQDLRSFTGSVSYKF